jgi:2,3-dihydroxy-p-cumate/2,3-dihydroxybenzoate 3,4-dioxygenase
MPRYSKLGYVALNVSDLDRSRHFYETLWGLEHTETGTGGELYFRCSDDHHNVVLYPSAARPGLKRVGWEMESERELDELAAAVAEHGIAVRELDAAERATLHQGRTIRFSDPYTGVTHEYYAEMRSFGGQPYTATVAKIQRLGHLVLWTPRYDEAVDFYLNVLNFRNSDTVEGAVTFMRCFPNPFHHSIGLANGKRRGLHHVNFMVTEIDDIGRGMWRFQANDVPIVRGPGRHPPSGSVFLYVLDPDELTVEYSFGMEEFPEQNPRKPRLLAPVPESLDYWNCPRDPRQGAVGEVEVGDAPAGSGLPPVPVPSLLEGALSARS